MFSTFLKNRPICRSQISSSLLISKRHATVVVGGSTKNLSGGRVPGRRRGPKKRISDLVKPNDVLVKQRWWIEPDRMWYGGFNVSRGKKGVGIKGVLRALCPGNVLYYYDTNLKRKFVHVVPIGEDKKEYMRPFYSGKQIYDMSIDMIKRRINFDESLNANKKNEMMNELRNKQMIYLNDLECIPLELIMIHENESINENKKFHSLFDKSIKISNVKPAFEDEQILHEKLK